MSTYTPIGFKKSAETGYNNVKNDKPSGWQSNWKDALSFSFFQCQYFYMDNANQGRKAPKPQN